MATIEVRGDTIEELADRFIEAAIEAVHHERARETKHETGQPSTVEAKTWKEIKNRPGSISKNLRFLMKGFLLSLPALGLDLVERGTYNLKHQITITHLGKAKTVHSEVNVPP